MKGGHSSWLTIVEYLVVSLYEDRRAREQLEVFVSASPSLAETLLR
jgi:hypothetical protein